MPHLRFTRDHRGYENTLLVDTVRRRGREQQRVLYWFRTPPQVKVGRAAIDEDAIRALEAAYPSVAFDWNRILEARPPEAEPAIDDPRRRARGKGARDRDGRRESRPERPVRPEPQAPPKPLGADPVPAPPTATLASVEAEPDQDEAASLLEKPTDPDPSAPPSGVTLISEDEQEGQGDALELPAHASEPSAGERLLGSEGLQRLRARHAEVCARIAAQVTDPERQEVLRTLAEQLNPDAWVTEPEVRAGLEQFEQVLDQVRREVGPLRKRTRRGGRRNRRRREQHATPAAEARDPQDTPADAPLDDASEDGTDEV